MGPLEGGNTAVLPHTTPRTRTRTRTQTTTRTMDNKHTRKVAMVLFTIPRQGIPIYTQDTRIQNLLSGNQQKTLEISEIHISAQCTQLPNDAERSTTTKIGSTVMCHGSHTTRHPNKTRTTLEDHIQICDKWAVCSIQYDQNGKNMVQASIPETAIVVCDGSNEQYPQNK
jgi:hypothetical protein